MAEKDGYTVQDHGFESPSDADRQGSHSYDRKTSYVEASNIFGDVQTAEQYGYVNRGLKSRHVQFIALGGAIGTGLFLGIGQALYSYGPLSILLGYSITGVFIFMMMMSLVSFSAPRHHQKIGNGTDEVRASG